MVRAVTALQRKLLRDLWRVRGQVVSIAAIVACGVMTVVALHGTLRSVDDAQSAYYARYRFADVFASARRVPEPVAARIAAIPGVARVETRVVMDVSLDVPGLDLPARGHVVSLPDDRAPALNRVHVRVGRVVAPGSTHEVVVGAGFAAANGIQVGDSLAAVMEGRWRRLRVVGIGLAPEFVWELSASGGFDTDERAFGVLWMSRRALEAASDMRGAFNDVSLALDPAASEPAVRVALDSLLAPYGGFGAVGRDRQPSHRILVNEFRQLRVFGNSIPLIFLFVAAFLLNVVMSRLVATQRAEIAALKAFGYTDREVGAHYLGFGTVAVLLGAVVGIALGMWIGGGYTNLYARYFRFPELQYRPDAASAAVAIGASAAAALLGALGAVRRAVRLPPAEALRPESPEHYRPLILERLGLGELTTPTTRMVLRTIERRPWRALSSMLGIALALGLLAGMLSLFDSIYRLVDVQFRLAMREDVAVSFHHARPAAAAGAELRRLPGVMRVETYRAVPVRARHEGRVRTIAVIGVDAEGALHRLVDRTGASFVPPAEGIVMSHLLAEVLGVRTGDRLRLELIERGGAVREVVVTGRFEEMIGTNAYMERHALDALAGGGGLASGAYLRVGPAQAPAVLQRLKQIPAVSGAASRRAMLESFDRQMTESIRMSGSIVAALAAVIALGVVYNGARIALSERGRDLASLRVLGFSRREVAVMLFGEQAVVVAAALPLGIACGVLFIHALALAFESEESRFPVAVELRTELAAIGIVVAAAVLAGLLMRRRVDRMDLVAVLKTRE